MNSILKDIENKYGKLKINTNTIKNEDIQKKIAKYKKNIILKKRKKLN